MKMSIIERIEKNRSLYCYLSILAYLIINNTINAFTVWQDHNRGGEPKIAFWEPFAWEYSSALSIFILIPSLILIFDRYPPRFTNIKKQLVIHLLASVAFSLLHVIIMVSLRKFIYFTQGGFYDFGFWPQELWYEYRKDALGYSLYFAVFHMIKFIFARLIGEALPIGEDVESDKTNYSNDTPKHFLIRKLDKEFLIKTKDIEWIESCANYVNLHIKGRIYPYRSTLKNIVDKLKPIGIVRIHRSYAINQSQIESISYQASGDGEIQLTSGKALKLSRRYKDSFKKGFI